MHTLASYTHTSTHACLHTFVMGVNHPPAFMSAHMNMTVTIFGFVLSALFMLIICCRLLCFRFNGRDMLGAARHRSNFVDRALQGLEPSTVASFPTVKYNHQIFVSSEDNLYKPILSFNCMISLLQSCSSQCAPPPECTCFVYGRCTICLGEYEEKEILRVLPRCGHAFHVVCIDVWLRQHPTCPVCRVSLQAFPEWRRVSGPLISLAARTRFAAGAIPDTLFEQPRSSGNVLITGLPKESMGHHKESLVHSERVSVNLAIANAREIPRCFLHPSRPMTAGHKGCVEMGESSLSRQQDMVADAEKLPHNKMVVTSFESVCAKDKAQTGTSAFKGEELSVVSQP